MAKVIVLPPNSLKRPLDGARIVFVPRPGGASPAPAGSTPSAASHAAQQDPAGLMRPAVDGIEATLARHFPDDPRPKPRVADEAQGAQTPEQNESADPAGLMRPAVDQIDE